MFNIKSGFYGPASIFFTFHIFIPSHTIDHPQERITTLMAEGGCGLSFEAFSSSSEVHFFWLKLHTEPLERDGRLCISLCGDTVLLILSLIRPDTAHNSPSHTDV